MHNPTPTRPDAKLPVTSRLADFAAGLAYRSLPDDIREQPRMFLLDTIAVALGACDYFQRNRERLLENYLANVAVPGKVTVLGYGHRTTPMLAAFANSTLAETLDFQDSHMDVLTHNSTPINPAALALAEYTSAPWSEIATAIVAGYEVHTRLLRTIQTGHWYRGFQGLGTFGTCGAATAAGRLLKLDGAGLKRAISNAGVIMPVSSSDNVFKAYTMKACIPAQAAQSGISAAYLAKAGFDGAPLEGDPPSFHAPLQTLSDGEPKLELALEDLGEVWYTRRVCYKPYPAGHLIIGPIEIILDLKKEHKLLAEDVEQIDIVTYKHAVFRTGKYASPESTYIDAHFSIPYCVAAALMDGQFTPRQIWKHRIKDPKVHELASRVILTEDDEMSKAYPKKWPVTLTVRLRNGKTVSKHLDEVKWSPERLPSWGELAQKFRMLADPLIGERRASLAVEMIAGLKPNDTLTSLLPLLVAQNSSSEAVRTKKKVASKAKGRR